MLYVKLKIALYGMLQAMQAIIRHLIEWVFKLNEYDQNVANESMFNHLA